MCEDIRYLLLLLSSITAVPDSAYLDNELSRNTAMLYWDLNFANFTDEICLVKSSKFYCVITTTIARLF